MPTVMEKEQAETSSAGATSTCPAKDRLKSLSPSGCPFHAEAGHEINGADSHSGSHQNGSKFVISHGNEASLEREGLTPPPTNGLQSPTSEASDETSSKNESDEFEASPKGKLPRQVGPSRKSRRSKKGGKDKDEKDDFKSISLKLLLPGQTETIDIMHVAKDTVSDLLQYAFEKPDCCYRTCLSVRLRGKKLDNFSELSSVPGLKDGSLVEIVEEPYTLRDVMGHIQRLQELIGVNVLQSSYSCTNGLSLSFLTPLISTTLDAMSTDNKLSESPEVPLPPDYITPKHASSSSTPSLSHFYPEKIVQYHQSYECLKRLSYSSWNPPTPNRKFKGDILYIDVKTLEGEDYCITACPSGFYLNRSVPETSFDPAPRKVAHHCQHLVTLLQQISALFRKNYTSLLKDGEKKNVYEIFPVPYPVYPWVLPKPEVKPIVFKIDEFCGLKAPTDELLVGQLRDWNEELQTTRELLSSTLQHRVFKDRALFKVQSDFIQAAIRGTKAAVDGHLYPLNPSDSERNHMFLWNNIFFSTGFDGRGHFKDFGGDEAGHAAANYDLQGVGILEKLGIKGLHTLGAVLIDYRGYRVFAQTIVPGLLQREQETSIVYGSMDNGKTFTRNEEFETLLKQCGSKLHIRPHKLLTEDNEEVELPVSAEVKGIDGTDGRHYVLDLFRIFPPDSNYSNETICTCDEAEASAATASTGMILRHKLYVMRPELVDLYLCAGQRLAMELHMYEEMKRTLTEQANSNSNKEGEADSEKEDVVSTKEESGSSVDAANEEGMAGDEKVSEASKTPEKEGKKEDTKQDELQRKLQDTITLSSLATSQTPVSTVSLDHTQFPSLQALSESSSSAIIILANDENGLDKATPTDLLVDEPDISKLDLEEGSEGSTTKNDRQEDDQQKTDQSPMEAIPLDFKDFDVLFNPDILVSGITHADSAEVLQKDKQNVYELSTYLTKTVIPKFLRDCIYLNVSPVDGTSLTTLLHSRGINIRYIGKIAMFSKTREDLDHIYRICVSEMILRTAKRRFRKLLLTTPLGHVSANIAHFLNCLLTDIEEVVMDESAATKKKPKKKKGGGGGGGGAVTRVTSAGKELSQGKLWKLLVEDVSQHYLYEIEFNSLTHLCNESGISKVSLLREFCNKTGIQILLKDYKFSLLTPFNEDDVVCIVPVVKHTDFKPLEASSLFELAQVQLQSGNVKLALDYLLEAVQLFAQVLGPMHVSIANCYRLIARIHHALGDNKLAISYQHKTVTMFERLLGVDHSSSISAYFHLAQYCGGADNIVVALKLLYRVRYLIMLAHGEDHPEMSNVDFYIGLLLSNAGHYEESKAYLESALTLQNKYHGSHSVTVATTHHLLANSLTHIGEFAEAKQNERKAYNIYRTKYGPEHTRTVQSYKDVRYITEKQVSYDQTVELAQGINKSKISVSGSKGRSNN